MTTRVKWVAELNHVREVSLLGSADLRFWQDQLAAEKLVPSEHDGRARIMIVTAEGRYMGVRFRELSISIMLTTDATAPAMNNACLLTSAFNSNPFFAFCERVLFSTPYDHAKVNLDDQIPAAISVVKNGQQVFAAAMKLDAAIARNPSREYNESLELQVILPQKGHSARRDARVFFARICGPSRSYPFLAGKDTCAIRSQSNTDVFRALLESQFSPLEWIIRSDATHAKSKTFGWSELAAVTYPILV